MRSRIFLAAVLLCFHGVVSADTLDINLNNDSAQLTYASNWQTAEFNVGFLSNSDKNDWAANLGLLTFGEQMARGSRSVAGIGGRLYAASVNNQDVTALALGGQYLVFPNNRSVGFGGYFFLAPDVVTFMDGKRFWEWGLRVEFEMIRRTANVYLGYRKMRVDLKDSGDVTLDSGGHIGIRIRF